MGDSLMDYKDIHTGWRKIPITSFLYEKEIDEYIKENNLQILPLKHGIFEDEYIWVRERTPHNDKQFFEFIERRDIAAGRIKENKNEPKDT